VAVAYFSAQTRAATAEPHVRTFDRCSGARRIAVSAIVASLGTFVLNDAISITLGARSHAVDVPEAALNNFNDGDRAVGTFPAVPTTWLENGCQRSQGLCTTDLAPHPRQSAGSSGKGFILGAGISVSVLY
jgi:hypothetical protein